MNFLAAVCVRTRADDSVPLARLLRWTIHSSAIPTVAIVCFCLLGRASAAGIINGDFQTGDLAGWSANTLNAPLTIPATVDVITVGGSLVGEVGFASSVGGHYAGSLSQDFYTGGATKLTFNIGYSASAQVTPGETNVVDTMDIVVQNLDTNTIIVHTLHAQNQVSTGDGLDFHINGAPIQANAPLSGSNTHVRIELLMDFHTLDGVSSSAQLLIDNVKLVPEPSTWVLAMCAALAMAGRSWLRCMR